MWTADSANTLTGLAMLRKKTVNNRFTATASTSGNWVLYEACLKTDHPTWAQPVGPALQTRKKTKRFIQPQQKSPLKAGHCSYQHILQLSHHDVRIVGHLTCGGIKNNFVQILRAVTDLEQNMHGERRPFTKVGTRAGP